MSDKRLSGKVAVITGGASGIGRALAEDLAGRGAEVVLADRQATLAEEVAREIRAAGGHAEVAELDVRDAAAFRRLALEVRRRSGHLDYLFNNAGIAIGGEVASYSQADWDEIIEVNLRGVTHGIQAVYPAMVAQGSGHIVNTASMAGLVPIAGECSYTATKHAVVGMTRSLRLEAARHRVRASVLCPGAIRTPILTGGRFGRINMGSLKDEQLMRLWEKMRPMPPHDFARKAVDAVLRNAAIVVLPAWWKVFWYLDRSSPALSARLWSAVYSRMRVELEAEGVKFVTRAPDDLMDPQGTAVSARR
jgi:NAD(P)-dependent dehydrogenase (short-subunit alcohol dehydrogenase family)